MDPISIILAALVAGAAAAAKETAGTAIKDAYDGFKGLLRRKLAGKTMATAAIDAVEEDPETAEVVLRPALKDVNVETDTVLVNSALAILANADPDGKIAAKYEVNVAGDVIGLMQGNHGTMYIDTPRPPRQ